MPPNLPPKFFKFEDKWILLTPKQLLVKNEEAKKNGRLLTDFINEESLYENVTLKGCFIKQLTKLRSLD